MLQSASSLSADVQARRLLVLDDDADVCATIGYIGEQVGMEVQSVQTAAAFELALAVFSPDVIVLDLLMPDCDGIEMLHRLHRLGCNAGIIINSGVGGRVLEAAGRTAHELGFNLLGILAKPFSPRKLRALLQSSDTSGPDLDATDALNVLHAPSACGVEITSAAVDAGLNAHQFRAYFQPKVRCVTGQLDGFEALVRWVNPTLGVLSPDLFLPMFETGERIDRMTSQMLDQALSWLAQMPEYPRLGMSINLSPRSLGDLRLADLIEQKCVDVGVDPARITLEITEGSAMEDPIAGLALTTRFCMKAFKLSIDDFGVGYSSLVQLARLPFAELKIDRQFVKDLPEAVDSRAIVEAIVLMAHRLGLSVTAEGVENLETLTYLAAIGCDTAQGFAIARPMDADAARQWIRDYQP